MIDLQNIQRMMQQEVTRQEFLQFIGVSILGLIGVTHVLNSIHGGLLRTGKHRPVSHGYGASTYGK